MATGKAWALPKGFTAWDGPMFKGAEPYPPRVRAETVVEVINIQRHVLGPCAADKIDWRHVKQNMRSRVVGYRIVNQTD